MYYIDYRTGAGNTTAKTLDGARKRADAGAAYTQQDIVIKDKDGETVATRYWWGVAYNPDEAEEQNPICFGDCGFYSDWSDMQECC